MAETCRTKYPRSYRTILPHNALMGRLSGWTIKYKTELYCVYLLYINILMLLWYASILCNIMCMWMRVKGHILIINSSMTANLKYADIIRDAKHLNLLLFTLSLANICYSASPNCLQRQLCLILNGFSSIGLWLGVMSQCIKCVCMSCNCIRWTLPPFFARGRILWAIPVADHCLTWVLYCGTSVTAPLSIFSLCLTFHPLSPPTASNLSNCTNLSVLSLHSTEPMSSFLHILPGRIGLLFSFLLFNC